MNAEQQEQMKRFEEIREEFKVKRTDFANALGIYPNHYSSMKNGKKAPAEKMFQQAQEAYGVNATWLKTGKGVKLIRMDKMNNINLVAVPLFPLDKQLASRNESFELNKNELSTVLLPNIALSRDDNMCFEVPDDRMRPQIDMRDYVACIRFPMDRPLTMYINKKFLFVTNENDYLVQILSSYDSDKHTAVFKSSNSAYPDLKINLKNEIKELWKVEVAIVVQ